MRDAAIVGVVRRHAVALNLETAGQRLLDTIDPGVSLVLIGEATHGTREFYRIRADLTRALIQRRGFTCVAAEADWPDAYRANRWVRLLGDDQTAEEALDDFTRCPRWMWRNREVVRFLRWLRAENACRSPDTRVGFYGLDLYSLHRSMARVFEYLDKVDPAAAARARRGYACFDVFGDDVQTYGYSASFSLERSCEDEVVNQLMDLRRRAAEYASRDGRIAADEYFAAEQNARVVCDAEAYYRAMFRGGAESWNLRDRHMMATLNALLDHATRQGRPARAVVWAHNSHLGNARATSLSQLGELNVGQLARERYGRACCSVGMTTHDGEVTAAHEWEEPAALRTVRPSLPDSYERLFHETGLESFMLPLSTPSLAHALAGPRLERAIGVLYKPETERASHYFSARLPEQFDLVVHVDRTRALEPLEKWARHESICPKPTRRESDMRGQMTTETRPVRIRAGAAIIDGELTMPQRAVGMVVFAHGSGSSRFSRRNRAVAQTLEDGGFATLLLDLLTREEEAIDLRTREYRFDIDRLAHRVVAAIDWAAGESDISDLPIACFGASTGAAAALMAAADRPSVRAVISRGGRPDLAGDALPRVQASTLLIVGGADDVVIELNRAAMQRMRAHVELEIVPGATHLFEEPGTLEQVSRLAVAWCRRYLSRARP